MGANQDCIEGVHMNLETHTLVSRHLMQQEVPQVRREVGGVSATTRGIFAIEERVPNTVPMTRNQSVALHNNTPKSKD
jgi:hypothetical protein